MTGSKEGWLKAEQKLLERYGGAEGLKKHRQAMGRVGGKKSTKSHLKTNPGVAAIIGSKGGSRSKKGYTFLRETRYTSYYLHKATGEEVTFTKGAQ